MIYFCCDLLWTKNGSPSFSVLSADDVRHILLSRRPLYNVADSHTETEVVHLVITHAQCVGDLNISNGASSDVTKYVSLALAKHATSIMFVRLHNTHMTKIWDIHRHVGNAEEHSAQDRSRLHFVSGCVAVLLGHIDLRELSHEGMFGRQNSKCLQTCLCINGALNARSFVHARFCFLHTYCLLSQYYIGAEPNYLKNMWVKVPSIDMALEVFLGTYAKRLVAQIRLLWMQSNWDNQAHNALFCAKSITKRLQETSMLKATVTFVLQHLQLVMFLCTRVPDIEVSCIRTLFEMANNLCRIDSQIVLWQPCVIKTVTCAPTVPTSKLTTIESMNVLQSTWLSLVPGLCLGSSDFLSNMSQVCKMLCKTSHQTAIHSLENTGKMSLCIVASSLHVQTYLQCSEKESEALGFWKTNKSLTLKDVELLVTSASRIKHCTLDNGLEHYVGLPWAALMTDLDVLIGCGRFYYHEIYSIHNICKQTRANCLNAVQFNTLECLLGLISSKNTAAASLQRLFFLYLPWMAHEKKKRFVWTRLKRILKKPELKYHDQIYVINVCIQRQCCMQGMSPMAKPILVAHSNNIRSKCLGLSASCTQHWSLLMRNIDHVDLFAYVRSEVLPQHVATELRDRSTRARLPFLVIPQCLNTQF